MSAGFRAGTSNDGYVQTGGVDQLSVDSSGNITVLNGALSSPNGLIPPTAFSHRNRIINGDCRVQQRGSLVLTSGVGGYGGPDRFYSENSVSGSQFTQSSSTMTINGVAYASCLQTVNTATSSFSGTNYWQGIRQTIEGYNSYDLFNQPFSVSFWFQATVTGAYSFACRDNGAAHSFVSSFTYNVANTPQYIKISVPASSSIVLPNSNAAGLLVQIGGLATGTYSTATLGSWQSGNYFTYGSAVNWAATANNTIALTLLQVESGKVDTPFEFLRIQDQLIQCQRYLQSWGPNVFFGAGGVVSASLVYTSIATATSFRAAPTVTYSGGTPTLYGPTGNPAVTSFSTVYWAANSANFGLAVNSSGMSAGQGAGLYTGGAIVLASAEL